MLQSPALKEGTIFYSYLIGWITEDNYHDYWNCCDLWFWYFRASDPNPYLDQLESEILILHSTTCQFNDSHWGRSVFRIEEYWQYSAERPCCELLNCPWHGDYWQSQLLTEGSLNCTAANESVVSTSSTNHRPLFWARDQLSTNRSGGPDHVNSPSSRQSPKIYNTNSVDGLLIKFREL